MLLLTIIDRLLAEVSEEDLRGKQADRLALTSEQRRWTRGRFVTFVGRDVAFALPTGTQLEPGQTIWIESDWYLTIEAAPEPLLEIRARDQREAIRIAFDVGNRHFPLAYDADRLLVPDDPAMIQLLDRIGAPWKKCTRAFNPIGKALRHES